MPSARSRNHRPGGAAFLLAQVGQHAAEMFAERISPEGLTPAQAGILGAISAEPGQSQQALSNHFGLLPSRMVAYLDDLEERGYVERRRSPTDRRLHALHLTPAGEELMTRLARLARQHDQLLTAALTPQQRAALQESLAIIAEQHGLTPGVHPGYRHVPAAPRRSQRGAPAQAATADTRHTGG
jgi:DNA-binding MarR family transcriptional regulator